MNVLDSMFPGQYIAASISRKGKYRSRKLRKFVNTIKFVLTDRMWDKVKDRLPGRQGSPGRTAADNRLFLEAVLWRVRTRAPWRDLPPEFGNWNSVFVRYSRWAEKGVFETIFKELSEVFGLEWAQANGAAVEARSKAAGGKDAPRHKRPSDLGEA